MKILICDDDPGSRAGWLRQIQKALPDGRDDIGSLEDAKREIGELLRRQRSTRERDPRREEPCAFDGLDVLVVDYDLVFLDDEHARHTGEEVARLCRLFSSCGYVVVMNQGNRTAHFDLTLTGRPASYADLNVAAVAIGEPRLWMAEAASEFRPWYWDDIRAVVVSRRKLSEAVSAKQALAGPINQMLKIPAEAIAALSDDAFEYINPDARSAEEFEATTFATFLEHTTEGKWAKDLMETAPERAAGLAVSRLSKWLSRMVLGPQDVLVDVPHLIERMPFLMDPSFGDPRDPISWERLTSAGFEAVIEPIRTDCRFDASIDWIGKPALWWPLIDRHEWIEKGRGSFDLSEIPPLVFAEDTSSFIPLGEATEFRSKHHNRYARRFIKKFPDRIYEPTRRLLEI